MFILNITYESNNAIKGANNSEVIKYKEERIVFEGFEIIYKKHITGSRCAVSHL